MASARIRGITIELGADAQGIKSTLANLNSSIRSTQSQMRDIGRLMKIDPTSTILAEQKYKALQSSISQTKDKISTLKEAESQLKAEMSNGGTEKQQQQLAALQREIIACEQNVKKFQNTVGSGSASLATLGARFVDAGSKITSLGQGLIPVTAAFGALNAAGLAAAKTIKAGTDNAIIATGALGAKADEIKESVKNVGVNVAGS